MSFADWLPEADEFADDQKRTRRRTSPRLPPPEVAGGVV
jgi:hypothetical protein